MRGCRTGKVGYRDGLAAKVALSRIRKRDSSGRDRTEKRAYQCGHCGRWHLTSWD